MSDMKDPAREIRAGSAEYIRLQVYVSDMKGWITNLGSERVQLQY